MSGPTSLGSPGKTTYLEGSLDIQDSLKMQGVTINGTVINTFIPPVPAGSTVGTTTSPWGALIVGSGAATGGLNYSGTTLRLGSISNHPINFLVNNAAEVQLDASILAPAAAGGSTLGSTTYPWAGLVIGNSNDTWTTSIGGNYCQLIAGNSKTDQQFDICGGSSSSAVQGGMVQVFGNTVASYQGAVRIASGDHANSLITLEQRGTASYLNIKNSVNKNATVNIKTKYQDVATSAGATVTTAGGFIPDGAVVLALTSLVLVEVTGVASFTIGEDGGDADRYGSQGTLTVGASTTHANYTATPLFFAPAATEVLLTAVGGTGAFTAGSVRLCLVYIDTAAPTA